MTTLPEGAPLGPYRILAPIGAGGMGEVYKAHDPRLDRVVAIKLLPLHWADNPEMRQRFEREARIVASLHHPNICVLHDIGQQDGHTFLVMEYLEGGTLAACLERGAMPWEAALQAAIAIAGALSEAHRSGVVHRDLKPGNVILTAGGPKLLDFGLAKWKSPPTASAAGPGPASQMATGTDITTPGAVLGTLQYMAPEQLEGLEADARTDIFAFGAMLHEMVTGRKAFAGKTRILLMSAIASAETEPVSRTQPAAPPGLDHIVKTCLAKDPADRWQTALDLLAELQWIAEAGAEAGRAGNLAAAPAPRQRAGLSQALLALAVLVLAAVAWPAVRYFLGPPQPQEFSFQVPFTLTAEPNLTTNPAGTVVARAGRNFAISPEGRAIVFARSASTATVSSLYVRPTGSVTPSRLAGTEGAAQPFWSADGRFVAFVAAGKLKKVEASGGPAQEICAVDAFSGGDWNREGIILFGAAKGLFRVSAQGGKPEPIAPAGPAESGQASPHFLPDGRHYLYTAPAGEAGGRAVFAGSLESKPATRVIAGADAAYYAEPGFLVFHRENAVYAQPFQPKTLALTGEPVRVADEVSESGNFAVSPNGVLAYFQNTGNTLGGAGGAQSDTADWQLTWVDRSGKVLEDLTPYGPYRGFEVSPDGKRVAVHRHDASGGDILILEPDRSVKKLTLDASHHNSSPVWSPDGKYVVYGARQKGKWGLYQTLSSGSGTEELLHESEALKVPMSWSPDGKRLVFWVQDAKTGGALWVLTLEDKKAAPLHGSAFYETHGQISPDGKWIAYTSTLTGRHEVHVQPFPSGTGHWQVSFHGGDWPRWKRDGKELLFRAIADTPDSPAITQARPFIPLYSAAVTVRGSDFEAASPKEILRAGTLNMPHSGGDYQAYAVSADAQRTLYTRLVIGGPAAAAAASPVPVGDLTVAMHWASALKK